MFDRLISGSSFKYLIIVDANDWLAVNGCDLVVDCFEGQAHQLLDDWRFALKLRPLKGETGLVSVDVAQTRPIV